MTSEVVAEMAKMSALKVRNDIKPFVILETPFMGVVKGDGDTPHSQAFNERYLNAALHDSLLRGEAPFASHGLYTRFGVLDDNIPAERELGMTTGWHVMQRASYVIVYGDLGFSSGMVRGCIAALKAGHKLKARFLPDEPWRSVVPRVVTPSADLDYIMRHIEIEVG